jgi:hypothetical protein
MRWGHALLLGRVGGDAGVGEFRGRGAHTAPFDHVMEVMIMAPTKVVICAYGYLGSIHRPALRVLMMTFCLKPSVMGQNRKHTIS